MIRVGFIGAGNMGKALIKAMQSVSSIVVYDAMGCSLKDVKVVNSNIDVVKSSEVIFLCVKPEDINSVLEEIKDVVKDQIIVSIAAGITLTHLEKFLSGKKLVRVMPNTPSLVGEMAAGYTLSNVKGKDAKLVYDLLNEAGVAIELSEKDLDAVTGLSGSGPAFFAYLIQGFIEGGIKQGLSADVATKLVLQTALGTAKLLQSGKDIDELIKQVTSKGGTTEAGRKVLEGSDVKEVIAKTIEAATKKSKELGS